MYNIVAPPRSVLQKDNVAIHFNTEERKIQEDMKNKIGEERFKKMQELRGKKDSLRHVKKLNNKATRKLKETIVQKGKKKWRSQSVKVMDSLSNEEKFVVRETINENTSTNTTVTNEMQKKESTSLLAKIKPYINANPQLNEVEDSRFSNKVCYIMWVTYCARQNWNLTLRRQLNQKIMNLQKS